MTPLYVRWDDELRAAFNRLAEREGTRRTAELLGVDSRNLYNYRRGLSTGGNGGGVAPRKFLSVVRLGLLALALYEPELENREALGQREWCDRGLWDFYTQAHIGARRDRSGRFLPAVR